MHSLNRRPPALFLLIHESLNILLVPFSMWLELRLVFNYLSQDPSTRAIILSGAGPKAFTSGLDVLAASQSGPLANGSLA